MQLPPTPNPRTGIRFRLHRCLSCWRRGIYVMTITPEDDDGNQAGDSVQYRICDRHAQEAMSALAPVAEEVNVTLDSGQCVSYRPEQYDG